MTWDIEIQTKYDEYLAECASSKKTTTKTPSVPRLVESIYSKTVEYNEAMQNTGGLSKLDWISLTSKLKLELDDLVDQDNAACAANIEADEIYLITITNEIEALKSRDDIKWDAVRAVRSYLLSQSDWTQLRDSPLSESKLIDWSNYRQLLRDIPEQYSTTESIVWPAAPE